MQPNDQEELGKPTLPTLVALPAGAILFLLPRSLSPHHTNGTLNRALWEIWFLDLDERLIVLRGYPARLEEKSTSVAYKIDQLKMLSGKLLR